MQKRLPLTLALAGLFVAYGCAPPLGTAPEAGRRAPTQATGQPTTPASMAAMPPAAKPTFVAAATKPSHYLGRAYLGAPLVDATVTAYDAAGKAVGAPFKTGSTGYFIQPTDGLPDRVELRATGGTLAGKPFVGELRGAVQLDELNGNHAALGAVSTLETEYLRRNGSASRAEAHARASTYLGLAAGLAPERAEAAVDGNALMAAAAAAGGFDAYVRDMAGHMLAGETTSRPMVDPKHRATIFGEDLTSFVGKNLAAGALSSLGGFAMGKILGKLDNEPTNADVIAKIEQLTLKVDEIKQGVDAVRTNLTMKDYDDAYDTNIRTLVAQIQTLERELAVYAQFKAAGDVGSAASTRSLINQTLGQLRVDHLQSWSNGMMGDGGPMMGMIKAYSKYLVAENGVFYSINEARRMEAWWRSMDNMRTLLVHLLVEKATSDATAPATTASLQANIMRPWLEQRNRELKQLRGVVTGTDVLDMAPVAGRIETGLNYVPEGYVYQYGAPVVWSSRGVIVKYFPAYQPPSADDVAAQNASMTLQGRPIYMWRRPTEDEVKSLLDWNTSFDFVSRRLSKANFRQFTGQGVVADAAGGGRRVTGYGYTWGGNYPIYTPAQDAVYVESWNNVWDWEMTNGEDSRACLQYYVSPYDYNAEPHWW